MDDDCDESPLTRRASVTGFEVNYINVRFAAAPTTAFSVIVSGPTTSATHRRADTFWVAVQGGDDDSSASGGLYLAQRRFRPGLTPPADTWQYGFVKQGNYDLEDRRVNTLDWGTGYGRYAGDDLGSPLDDHLSNVHLSVLGGDWWDGGVEAE